MKTLHRFSYIALVFLLSALLIRTIYYGVSVLWVEQYRYTPRGQGDYGHGEMRQHGEEMRQGEKQRHEGMRYDANDETQMRKPTPEEIVHHPDSPKDSKC
jgi:hypothetical protein